MNGNIQNLINTINSNIKPNGNQDITALVLNPILVNTLIKLDGIIGGLTDLDTTDKSSIVNAINSLLISVNNIESIKIHSGGQNPNVVPPSTPFELGDFYQQIDVNTSQIIDYFVFTGVGENTWISLTEFANGNYVSYNFQPLTPSQQAQVRENIGISGSWYTQYWTYDKVNNPNQEFPLHFAPTQILSVDIEGTILHFEYGEYEYTTDLIVNKLKINNQLTDGQRIYIIYYHNN